MPAPTRHESMNAPARGGALSGRGIVITRPQEQAHRLAGLVGAEGGNPILFPVLEILDSGDLKPLNALIDRLDEFDLAVFISPSAVNKAMNLICARRTLPPRLRVAAIGRGSTRELKHFGVNEVIAPGRKFDSEALLEMPELQDVRGRRIVIFRGDGGRELLGDTLVARGATIEYAECYRRRKPDIDAAPLLRAWARNELHAIVVTSSEGLRNLFDLVGKLGQSWLRTTPLFVTHARIAATARALGLSVIIESGPADEGLVAKLIEYFRAG
jgi:uroporphyrinogen-III synthase